MSEQEQTTDSGTAAVKSQTDDFNTAATDSEPTAPHPLACALDAFLHRCEDIKEAAELFISLAAQIREDRFEKLLNNLKEGEELLARPDAASVVGIRKTQRAVLRLNHLSKSKLPEVIESSLFLGLFSAFDAFTGQLITAIYRRKPELFTSLSRSVTVSEILGFKSFEELQTAVLRDEIEDFRRKSYVDQFKELETTFGLKLRSFEKWPLFVECGQRRNLITHCDAEVSEQYLEVCEREGYVFTPRPKIGDRLELGAPYFLPTCDLLAEVALKLTHTLWRKLLPHELESADKELNAAIYDRLQLEEFVQARVYSQFAYEQKSVSSDLHRRIFLVNYAIALKFGGKAAEARTLLKQVDWTACAQDFKLAEAVLDDRNADACEIMKRIGKKGEILSEDSYHVWPLFRSFQTTPEFLKTYEEIYGRPFITELQKAADKAQVAAGAESANPSVSKDFHVEDEQ